MERRPTRWHPVGAPAPRSTTGPGRIGNIVVVLIIVGCVLLIGMAAPQVRFSNLLALLGLH